LIFLNAMRLIVSYCHQSVTFKQTGEIPDHYAKRNYPMPDESNL
jgi:hypothetical protein